MNRKMHCRIRHRRAKMGLAASARPSNFSSSHHLYFCVSTGQFSVLRSAAVVLTDFPARFCFREPFCSSRDRSRIGRAGNRAWRIYLFLSYALAPLRSRTHHALNSRPSLSTPLSAFSGSLNCHSRLFLGAQSRAAGPRSPSDRPPSAATTPDVGPMRIPC